MKESLKEKLTGNVKENVIKAIKYITILIISFLISYYPLSYNLSPLGISFAAALKFELSPYGLIGAAIGYMLSPARELLNIRYVTSLIALAVIRGALLNTKKSGTPLLCGLSAAFVCLITGITAILSTRITLSKILLCLFESALCGGSGYFFKAASSFFPIKDNINHYDTRTLISSGVSAALIILSLAKFEIGPVNPTLLIVTYILITISMYGSPYFGCFVGASAALIIALGTGSIYILASMTLISVLLCLFYRTEIPVVMLFLVVAAIVTIPISEDPTPNIMYAIHYPTASLLFLITSSKVSEKVGNFLSVSAPIISGIDDISQEFKVNMGVCQIASDDKAVMGDAYTSFYTNDGKFVIVLSDGMGTGKPAYLISNLSVKILKALLKDGVSFRAAINLLNAAVIINSRDETLTTADVLCIDCSTGKVDLYKAGAAATLIKRGHSVLTFEKTSLPVGILRNTDFSHLETSVLGGDIILMSSDGIWVGDDAEIKQLFSKFGGDSMNDLAKKIAKTALSPKGDTDDITVIAAKVESC